MRRPFPSCGTDTHTRRDLAPDRLICWKPLQIAAAAAAVSLTGRLGWHEELAQQVADLAVENEEESKEMRSQNCWEVDLKLSCHDRCGFKKCREAKEVSSVS
eukprot:149936-Pelagomonas_calceolata.AAC.3